jgi:WD40 repeat protein
MEIGGRDPQLSDNGRWIYLSGHYFSANTGAMVQDLSELSAGPTDRGASHQILFRLSSKPARVFDIDLKQPVNFPVSGSDRRFSEDGRYCLIHSGDDSVICQTQTRGLVARSEAGGQGPCLPVAFSADGSLAVTQEDKAGRHSLTLWDWRAGKRTLLVDRQDNLYARFARDGRQLVTTATWPVKSLILWDVTDSSSPQKMWEQNPSTSVLDVQFSSDGGRVLFADGNDLVLVDAKTGNDIQRFHSTRKSPLQHIVMSPDGRLGATASERESEIDVWRLPDPR